MRPPAFRSPLQNADSRGLTTLIQRNSYLKQNTLLRHVPVEPNAGAAPNDDCVVGVAPNAVGAALVPPNEKFPKAAIESNNKQSNNQSQIEQKRQLWFDDADVRQQTSDEHNLNGGKMLGLLTFGRRTRGSEAAGVSERERHCSKLLFG